MARDAIPDDIRRFVLTCIPSVPYLEAMLLMREEPKKSWDSARLARRLYINKDAAAELLTKLCEAGVLTANDSQAHSYLYHPGSSDLQSLIDRTAVIYSKHLRDVTDLIHSQADIKVQQFADAFKIRKDT